MTPLLPMNAAVLIILLANGSALAQGVDQKAARTTAPIIAPASQAAMIMAVNAVAASEGMNVTAEPLLGRYSMFFEEHKVTITEYVHTNTIKPVMEIAQDAGEWLASTSGDMVSALKGSGEWIASGSNIMVSATSDAGEWLASGPGIMVTASKDAGQWIASGSSNMMVAARDASEWVGARSSAITDAVVSTASITFSGFTLLEDWSSRLVREVEEHLRADKTSKFALLIEESGFALTDIKVGLGIIPELDVEFRHERDLTPAEKKLFKKHVDEYTSTASGPVGFFEGILLRRLEKAGEFSGNMRISEIHIDVFPLPGLELFFDPFSHEKDQQKMLVDAYDFTKIEAKKLKTIEDRISEIETRLSTPGDPKAVD